MVRVLRSRRTSECSAARAWAGAPVPQTRSTSAATLTVSPRLSSSVASNARWRLAGTGIVRSWRETRSVPSTAKSHSTKAPSIGPTTHLTRRPRATVTRLSDKAGRSRPM